MNIVYTGVKAFFIFCILFLAGALHAQTVDAYFQKIRKNEAELTAFIAQMPKGGDLHNHFTGAIYAETYVNWVIDRDLCVNLATLEVTEPESNGNCAGDGFSKFSTARTTMKGPAFETLKNRLIRFWSTKEYDQVHSDAREEHFFSTFGNFGSASGLNYAKGLEELKLRAKSENVSYIELMLPSIKLKKVDKSVDLVNNADTVQRYNDLLIRLGQNQDKPAVQPLLQNLYTALAQKLPLAQSAASVNQLVDSLHRNYIAGDPAFTMQYLAFVARINDPLVTFINLITAFETVNRCTSGNLVGLNFVAPEDHPVSMRDYWLHMQMFAFCHAKYPQVRYTLHAGELTEGVVKPEDLTWHISSAVNDAGAGRIGHGVDIAYEQNSYTLLRNMARKKIPVEINLLSNEFILGVKDDRHPVLLYKHFHVPIVISTDDPGISRTSLTEQYVLLAHRYPEITYQDIKSYAFNSIQYSFIKDTKLKERLRSDLKQRFAAFERNVLANKP
jgi:hypothetical protein